jgi:hypothetical protein
VFRIRDVLIAGCCPPPPPPNPDFWHQNNADPHADPTPSFTHNGKIWIFSPFSHSIATLQCSIILISVNCDLLFQYPVLWIAYWNFLENSLLLYQHFQKLRIDTDPDPSKWCGSDPIQIRIQNTAII